MQRGRSGAAECSVERRVAQRVVRSAPECGNYNFAVTTSTSKTSFNLPPGYTLSLGAWPEFKTAARAVRMAVFVIEQNIPVELEWDEWDESSLHAVVFDAAQQPVGTGRLLPPEFDLASPATGHIGRMAVLAEARRHRIGSAVLQALMQAAPSRGFDNILLHAQSYVAPFYAQHGYLVEGAEFIEAGIPHRTMRAPLLSGRSA